MRKKFETPEVLQALIDEYFAKIEDTDEIADVEGLALHCRCTRECLNYYEYHEGAVFTDIVKFAKTKIFFEKKQLAMKSKMNPAVFIFDSKNNHGYVDKIEIDNTFSQGGVEVVFNLPQLSKPKPAQLEKENPISCDYEVEEP